MRGIQRKMIVIRTENSPYFEEAHFLLKRDQYPEQTNGADILKEANRIVEESLFPYARRKHSTQRNTWLRAILLFAAGSLAGGGLIALILLL